MRLKQFLKDGGRKYNDSFYDTTDIQASQKVGIPVDILRAVRLSGEKSNENQVSSAGARGVYQFIPSVRNSVLKKYGVDAWNPNQSSLAAAYLLKESANRNNGNYIDAIREYHGGIDRKNWGKVNQAYINRVQSFLGNNNKDYTNSQSIMDYSNAMRQGLQDIFIAPELKTFNPLFNTPTQDQMSQYLEYQKLEQERLQQEQNKAIQEQQNQQIQQALLQKEQEKKQILDMIPQLQSVAESSNIKPII